MNDELQVIDLQVGEGKAAVKGALITTQYTGWLEDGTEFDSSWSRGKPFQCVIGTGRVIKGWDQGLMGMKVGGKRRLFVPAHLGYGERQMGRKVDLPMSRQDMADYLGLTIETVSRTITKLVSRGVITPNGRHAFDIAKPGKLLALCGDGDSYDEIGNGALKTRQAVWPH